VNNTVMLIRYVSKQRLRVFQCVWSCSVAVINSETQMSH